MTGLTTHVLDTALGKPAQGLRIQLMRMNGEEAQLIKTWVREIWDELGGDA